MTEQPDGPVATVDAAALEAEQDAALRRARRNATGLLAVVAVLFLGATQLPDTTWAGYVQAALEAGLVGGLADWFAVVALFRHPLGIPIPHTAVIPRSKDGLGQNLAGFVEGNFLTGPQVRERIGDPKHVERVAVWLADEANADRAVARVALVADAALDALDEDDVVARAAAIARERLRRVPVARLAGQALGDTITEGRHDPVVDAVLDGLVDTLVRNRQVLRRRLGEQSPSWVPPVVDDLVFTQGEHVVRTFLQQLAADREHELRRSLDEQLLAMTARLTDQPELQDRVDDAVADVLTDELLERWIGELWRDARTQVATAAREDAEGAAVRATAVAAVVGLGERLEHDDELRGRAVALLEQAAEPIAAVGQREVGGLIAATVERWDAQDTSRRLERWLGRDLQFVRINGTLVGALVGLGLHAVTLLLA